MPPQPWEARGLGAPLEQALGEQSSVHPCALPQCASGDNRSVAGGNLGPILNVILPLAALQSCRGKLGCQEAKRWRDSLGRLREAAAAVVAPPAPPQ